MSVGYVIVATEVALVVSDEAPMNSGPLTLDSDCRDESERSLVYLKTVVLSSDDTAGD